MKIIDYTIIRYSILANLIETVKWKIDNGWVPLGSAAIDGNSYIQTMVKYEEQIISQ